MLSKDSCKTLLIPVYFQIFDFAVIACLLSLVKGTCLLITKTLTLAINYLVHSHYRFIAAPSLNNYCKIICNMHKTIGYWYCALKPDTGYQVETIDVQVYLKISSAVMAE